MVLASRRSAAIDRRAANLQGMGECQPTIILERAKFRINIDHISVCGSKAAPGNIAHQVVTGAGDRAVAIRSAVVVLGDDAVLYGNCPSGLIMNASRDGIIDFFIIRIIADSGIVDMDYAAKIIDSTTSATG